MPKVKLAGNMFGETYHVAAAMLLTNNLPVESDWYQSKITYEQDPGGVPPVPLTTAQITFLDGISIFLKKSEAKGGELSKADCTEKIIAPAFENGSDAAKEKIIRGFFIGGFRHDENKCATATGEIKKILEDEFDIDKNKAIIWTRNIPNQTRNMTTDLLGQIINSLNELNIHDIVFMGDALDLPSHDTAKFYDLRGFHNKASFQSIMKPEGSNTNVSNDFTFAVQLLTFYILKKYYNVRMQIGMKQGAMDGPAFIGIPTIFFEEMGGSNDQTRMGAAAKTIPWMKRVTFPAADYNSNESCSSSSSSSSSSKAKKTTKHTKMPEATMKEFAEAVDTLLKTTSVKKMESAPNGDGSSSSSANPKK